MQIKKKILMMSLAASMVIPNTLAFSMAYPIYAEEMMETNTIPSDAIEVTQQDFTDKNSTIFESTTTNTYTFKRGQNFKLKEDIDLGITSGEYTINLPSSTKLYLNDKKITIGGSGNAAFGISGQGAEINGPGTIIYDRGIDSSKYINIYGFYLANNASFKMNEVTLNSNENANIFYFGPGSQVDVNNSKIENGEMAFLFGTNKVGSTLKLKNTTVNSKYGIRSHYIDTIQVENCIFNYGYTGIESRGTTTVLNSKFTCTLDKDSYSQNYYFPPTRGIDIVRSELTSPLNVKIDGIDISKGDAGIVIADLCSNSDLYGQNPSQVLNVNISNSTLEGKICGLGYTDNTLPFTLKNVKITDTETEAAPKKLKSTTLGVYGVELDPNFDGSGAIPYTVVSDSDSSASLTLATIDSSQLVTKDENSGLLTSQGQDAVKTKLQEEVKTKETTAQSTNEIPLYADGKLASAQNVDLNYTYNVLEVNPIFSIVKGEDGSQEYKFEVKLTAQLTPSSIICLLIPIKGKAQSSEVDEEIETMVLLETENSDQETKTNYPVYVELSEVLKNKDNPQSGLDSSKIEGILKNLKEEKDLAQIEFDTSDLKKFENFNLNEAFVIKDIGEIIEFEASQAPNPTPTYRPSGGSKPKPKPEEPAQEEPMAPVATPTTMYRLYNRLTGEHLYTTDKAERDSLLTSDTWQNENRGWIAPSISDYPVYRLLNPNTGDHHYTTDKNEFDTLPVHGWIAEGIAFYSADKDNEENVILHRLYNPNAQGAGSHHYTTDENERDTLVAQGWKYEGMAWAGLKSE